MSLTRVTMESFQADGVEGARAAWDVQHRCEVCSVVTEDIRSRAGVAVCSQCVQVVEGQLLAMAAAQLIDDNTTRAQAVAAWLAAHPDHAHPVRSTRPVAASYGRP